MVMVTPEREVPGIAMAGGYELLQLLQGKDGATDWAMMGLGTAVAAVTGYLCIHWLLAVINRIGLAPFALYRFAVAALILIVLA
jgi:undecaprenyl-diphosphatase